MNYSEAVNFITNLEKFGSVFGLETIRELLHRLGDPDKKLRFIHIAGTNGKGSVSCYLTSILKEAGFAVGTFNSPSVYVYNERYLFNSVPIDDEAVARLITTVNDCREQMRKENMPLPTAFEFEFAVALLWFCEMKCDIVVLETGLGGRLDATNAIEKKEIAIITSIALDHTQILGDTLAKIAREKMGIVKNCPLVTFKQNSEIMTVLNEVDDLVLASNPVCILDSLNGQAFLVDGVCYSISMLGKHQLENAALAIKSVEILRELGFEISDEALHLGLSSAKWQGRLELMKGITNPQNGQEKFVILDGAHNPDGARVLQDALKNYFDKKSIALVFGMFADKDVLKVAGILCVGKSEIYTVTPPSKRGLDAEKLKQIVFEHCTNVEAVGSIAKAVELAIQSDCEVVCVCGSLSILSTAREEIFKLGGTNDGYKKS